MIGCRNIPEVEKITIELYQYVREWIKLNRHDLDSTLPMEELLEKEVCLFTRFDPYDVDNETGEFSLKLDEYAICNKSYAVRNKLQYAPTENGGNINNLNQYLNFYKLK